MTWFKVDDKLHDHRKARRARKGAMGVWVLAGSWAADNLTDGFVPADVLPRWGTRADATALVNAGLWAPHEKDGETGWLFRNWREYQPTKAEVETERKKKADAGRKGGRASGRSRREARASAGASAVVEPPTRPDPFPSAAAAAEDAAAAADQLPTSVAILRDKLQAHTALQALRFDGLTQENTSRLEDLIALHGDHRLVDTAIRTLRTPPPVHVAAFLGTWSALPAPGQKLRVIEAECDLHPGQPARACISCAADRLAGDA